MIEKRLNNLRKLMRKEKIDFYFLPGKDPHRNSYIHESMNRKLFMSGYTGSNANIVISKNNACLWTDGRYELQVKKELKDTSYKYFVKSSTHLPYIEEITWIIENSKKGDTIGIDANLININEAKLFENKVKESNKNLKIVYQNKNLVDEIWEDRPNFPKSIAYFRDEKYENITAKEKIKNILKILKEKEQDFHLISNLESIARLLNVRGFDVKNNLLLTSYLLLGVKKSYWFIETKKLPKEYNANLPKNFEVLPYEEAEKNLKKLTKNVSILIDPNETSKAILDSVSKDAKIIYEESPLNDFKAIKNDFEINNFKIALKKDCVAFLKTIKWLKEELKKNSVSEYELACKVEEHKKEVDTFIVLSFETIIGYMQNAAIIHYKPNKKTCIDIKNEGIVLIDCGAHYHEGTTDMTRTIKLGEVSQEIKDDYTRVLKGHLALNSLAFPIGTSYGSLDAIARKNIWKNELDFKHGVGHGVGYVTSVHETSGVVMGQGVNKAVKEGITISNEPGIYKEGKHGIRIENIITPKKANTDGFLKFTPLTFFPYEKDLINKNLLSKEELEEINQYHAKILEELGPLIKDEELLLFLEELCSSI
jgi:Xaa-Pro aminopeptidase